MKSCILIININVILQNITVDSKLVSENGKEVSALKVFSYGLAYFKDHSLRELSDQSGRRITSDQIKWVITVPAIWKASAKQFMRQAAYNVSIQIILPPLLLNYS